MKRGKRVLSLVLCLVLVCALAAPAKAAEEVTITWLPEGVTPVDASGWSVKRDETQLFLGAPAAREVKKGDLIAVKQEGKYSYYGYVDLSGELVVPFTDTQGYEKFFFFFSDGLLPVRQYDSDGTYTGIHYVDRTGKTVIELGDEAWGYAFSDGAALVFVTLDSDNEGIGAIDTKGNTVVPYEYDDMFGRTWGFVGGFARLEKKIAKGQYEWFFVSADGKTVISISEYDKVRNFSGGLAAVCKDGKWGYIDTAGNLKIPCEYRDCPDYCMDAQNGMVVLRKDGKFGYANTKGEIVIPFEYTDAFPFNQNGLARVRPEGEDSYIYIDKNGKKADNSVREKLAAEGYEFSTVRRDDGLIFVTKDGKRGLADEQGEILIPAEYGMLEGSSGLFWATTKDGKYGYINQKGEVVVPFEFELKDLKSEAGLIMNGYIGVVYRNGRYGIFENPYYEEPKPAGLFSFGSGGSSSGGSSSGGSSSSGGLSPLLPVAGVLAAAVAGGLVLLKKKKRPQA